MGRTFTSEGRKPLRLFGVTVHGEYLSARGYTSDDPHTEGEMLISEGKRVELLQDLEAGFFFESGDTIPQALKDPLFLLIDSTPAPDGQKEQA